MHSWQFQLVHIDTYPAADTSLIFFNECKGQNCQSHVPHIVAVTCIAILLTDNTNCYLV